MIIFSRWLVGSLHASKVSRETTKNGWQDAITALPNKLTFYLFYFLNEKKKEKKKEKNDHSRKLGVHGNGLPPYQNKKKNMEYLQLCLSFTLSCENIFLTKTEHRTIARFPFQILPFPARLPCLDFPHNQAHTAHNSFNFPDKFPYQSLWFFLLFSERNRERIRVWFILIFSRSLSELGFVYFGLS